MNKPSLLAWSLTEKGLASLANGDLHEARRSLGRALDISEQSFGPNGIASALAINALGLVEDAMGQDERASIRFLRALEILLADPAATDRDVATVVENVGRSLRRGWGLDRYLPFLHHALSMHREIGDHYNHPSVLQIEAELGAMWGGVDPKHDRRLSETAIGKLRVQTDADDPTVDMRDRRARRAKWNQRSVRGMIPTLPVVWILTAIALHRSAGRGGVFLFMRLLLVGFASLITLLAVYYLRAARRIKNAQTRAATGLTNDELVALVQSEFDRLCRRLEDDAGDEGFVSKASAGTCLLRGEAEACVAILDPWLRKYPTDSAALRLRALALNKLERGQDACSDLNTSLELAPDSAFAWFQRSEWAKAIGDTSQAEESLQRAAALVPEYLCARDVQWPGGDAGMVAVPVAQSGSQDPGVTRVFASLIAAKTQRLVGRRENALVSSYRLRGVPEAIVTRAKRPEYLEDLVVAELSDQLRVKPGDPELLEQRATMFWGSGLYEEALADILQALSLEPDNDDRLGLCGEVLNKLGRHEEALAAFNRALELEPDNLSYRQERGVALVLVGQPDEAIGELTRFLQSEPRNAWALAHRGLAYRRLGRYEEALKDLTRALKKEPRDSFILNSRGAVLFQLARYEEALADFSRALKQDPNNAGFFDMRGLTLSKLGRYEDAVADFTRSLELVSDDPFTLGLRGAVYRMLGRHEDALRDLDGSVEREPDEAHSRDERGATLLALGRHEEAALDFTRSLEIDADDPWIWRQRADAYLKSGRHEEAIVDLTRVLELTADNLGALRDRGEAYRKSHRPEDALEDLSRALTLAPNDRLALIRRGNVLLGLLRFEEAIADFTRCLDVDPDDAWALGLRGMARRWVGRHEESLADFDRCVAMKPDAPFILGNRADTLTAMGRHDDAIEAITTLLELEPGHVSARLERARLHQQVGVLDKAHADLEQVVKLVPTNLLALREQAESLQRSGRFDDAVAALTQLIELSPDKEWVPQALTKYRNERERV